MIIPTAYATRRNLAKSYRRGFQAGTVADLGGVPLAPYLKLRSKEAYNRGFDHAQLAKGQPASQRIGDCVDAFAYGVAAHIGFDPAQGEDRTVVSCAVKPTPRELELLAFLERLKAEITEMLHGGIH